MKQALRRVLRSCSGQANFGYLILQTYGQIQIADPRAATFAATFPKRVLLLQCNAAALQLSFINLRSLLLVSESITRIEYKL